MGKYLQRGEMKASELVRDEGGQSQREREGWEAKRQINHQWPWCCNIEKSQWPGTKLSTHTSSFIHRHHSISLFPSLKDALHVLAF